MQQPQKAHCKFISLPSGYRKSPFSLQFLIMGPKKIRVAFSFQGLDDSSPAGATSTGSRFIFFLQQHF